MELNLKALKISRGKCGERETKILWQRCSFASNEVWSKRIKKIRQATALQLEALCRFKARTKSETAKGNTVCLWIIQ